MSTNIQVAGMTAPGVGSSVSVPNARVYTISVNTSSGDGVADFEIAADNNFWFTPTQRELILDDPSGVKVWRMEDFPMAGIRAKVSSLTTGRVDVYMYY